MYMPTYMHGVSSGSSFQYIVMEYLLSQYCYSELGLTSDISQTCVNVMLVWFSLVSLIGLLPGPLSRSCRGILRGGGGGGGTPYIFHIGGLHMCRLFLTIFSRWPPKNGHLLSICHTNSQASQIIIDHCPIIVIKLI